MIGRTVRRPHRRHRHQLGRQSTARTWGQGSAQAQAQWPSGVWEAGGHAASFAVLPARPARSLARSVRLLPTGWLGMASVGLLPARQEPWLQPGACGGMPRCSCAAGSQPASNGMAGLGAGERSRGTPPGLPPVCACWLPSGTPLCLHLLAPFCTLLYLFGLCPGVYPGV